MKKQFQLPAILTALSMALISFLSFGNSGGEKAEGLEMRFFSSATGVQLQPESVAIFKSDGVTELSAISKDQLAFQPIQIKLNEGSYFVKIKSSGYKEMMAGNIRVSKSKINSYDFNLDPVQVPFKVSDAYVKCSRV